eukprot:TRINITY_DN44284_c0_g1_i2.p1 TRINITY_DN44284_c0_g1~~TRINITY_DN44284_c0_g1_i2.p1  ORF type:complete len:1758 (-),score=323.25 TRINITY_DN44284_c0_g1_i2:1654-6927(-)
MSKPCQILGEFIPFGREFLGDDEQEAAASSYALVGSEVDGVVAEEELYVAGDGRVVWSSGRQMVRGFREKCKVVQALFCSFSGVTHDAGSSSGGSSSSSAMPSTPTGVAASRCLVIVEPERLRVHSPGGGEFVVRLPSCALRAWPLADGLLILLRSPEEGRHCTLSLVGHPLNLPRCVSYVDRVPAGGLAGPEAIWKDSLAPSLDAPSTGLRVAKPDVQIRWVCCELPLAVAFVQSEASVDNGSSGSRLSGRHAVYLTRRRLNSAASSPVAMPRRAGGADAPAAPAASTTASGCALEAAAIYAEPSEVYLQQLWAFPDDSPPCEPDDCFLLAPDSEFACSALCMGGESQASSSARSGGGAGSYGSEDKDRASSPRGLLLALFVRATGRLHIVRLWTWETVAVVASCNSVVALLPDSDTRTFRSCASGLSSFPSAWQGATHSRIVLWDAVSPPLPSCDGLPEALAKVLLDPLELVRAAAVLNVDRHAWPKHLLILEQDGKTLVLHSGRAPLCRVALVDPAGQYATFRCPIQRMGHAVANRLTLHCEDGRAFRCLVPLQPRSPLLAAALTTTSLVLPSELASKLTSDIQVWCICRGTSRTPSADEDDREWRRFCELLFCLIEQALTLACDGAVGAPPFKRARAEAATTGVPSTKSSSTAAAAASLPEAVGEDCSDDDWEWLLGSAPHARERLNPTYAASLASSADFLPHASLRVLATSQAARGGGLEAGSAAGAVASEAGPSSREPGGGARRDAADLDAKKEAAAAAGHPGDALAGAAAVASSEDVWEGPTVTPPPLLLKHLDIVFLTLHLLYEEWKMHTLHSGLLQPLAQFLFGVAQRLGCSQFATFYAQDFPAVRDSGLAMAAFGGYGAWLWEVFPCGGSGNIEAAARAAEAVQRLREVRVPHLLAAARGINAGCPADYPEIFPLSRLLLNMMTVLKYKPNEIPKSNAGGTAAALGLHLEPPSAVALLPGISPRALQPPSPLPPFTSHAPALADAERARAVKRWLRKYVESGGQPWEVVLILLVQHRVRRSDIDFWSLALAAPVHECLRAAAEQPSSDWLVEAYNLIGREDLALLAQGHDVLAVGEERESAATARSARDLLESAAGFPSPSDLPDSPSHHSDPMESSEWLYRMFDRDRRVKEVARLLCSSKPVTLRVQRRPEQTDHDHEHAKQTRLALAVNRQAALSVGRGAFTLGAVRPLPTELLHVQPLSLAGRFPPQTAVLTLDPTHHQPEVNAWAEFNNGVATALQVSERSDITRGWILHHKADLFAAAAASASQTPPATTNHRESHAGFLCGLGLRGLLSVLPVFDCYKYLRHQHEATSVAVILGMAASHKGTMNTNLIRMCCVHIPSMLPSAYSDLEVASPVQCAAVVGLGLLFAKSGHRMMTELLVAEMGRRPSDRSRHDREGYSLAAGFALGCVCLGVGGDAPGLADLSLHTWLLRYVHGGPEMTLPGVAARAEKQNPNHDPAATSSLILDPEGVNTSVTSMAGCLALALVFLRTNCETVASHIVIPRNRFQLDYIRPDFAMLRLVARSLIMWDYVEPSQDWIENQIPSFLDELERRALVHMRAASAVQETPLQQPAAPQPLSPFASDPAMQTPEACASRATPSPQFRTSLLYRGYVDVTNTPSPAAAVPRPGNSTTQSTAQGPKPANEALSQTQLQHLLPGDLADVDWLLLAQTRASLVAGADCPAQSLPGCRTFDDAPCSHGVDADARHGSGSLHAGDVPVGDGHGSRHGYGWHRRLGFLARTARFA